MYRTPESVVIEVSHAVVLATAGLATAIHDEYPSGRPTCDTVQPVHVPGSEMVGQAHVGSPEFRPVAPQFQVNRLQRTDRALPQQLRGAMHDRGETDLEVAVGDLVAGDPAASAFFVCRRDSRESGGS